MRLLIFILTVLFIYSCENHHERIVYTTDKQEINSNEKSFNQSGENIDEDLENHFDILLPTEYRDYNAKNEADKLNSDWMELYLKDGNYYLSKVFYEIERGFSECSGDSTKILSTKNKTILFIKNANIKSGEINSVRLTKNEIWPNEKLSFNLGKLKYTLRAEGDIKSTEINLTDNGEEKFQVVENYKLYLTINNLTETLLLEQKSFNNTFVKLIFVGDIDRDGNADFIFSANRDYEEIRVLLFMSNKSQKASQIRKVAEIAVQFDC